MFSIPSSRVSKLRQRYAESHRAYHNQAHIDSMLKSLIAEADLVTDADTMALAIWYHDAIYEPGASDNEIRSADLLASEMEGVASSSMIVTAEAMILATANHHIPVNFPEASRGDLAIFLDFDMAVLGSPPAEYDCYEAGIAAEFIPVYGPAEFSTGRANFLRDMLSRDRLFYTDRIHQRLDAAARSNLKRALERGSAQ